jgi:hypothetical protein
MVLKMKYDNILIYTAYNTFAIIFTMILYGCIVIYKVKNVK